MANYNILRPGRQIPNQTSIYIHSQRPATHLPQQPPSPNKGPDAEELDVPPQPEESPPQEGPASIVAHIPGQSDEASPNASSLPINIPGRQPRARYPTYVLDRGRVHHHLDRVEDYFPRGTNWREDFLNKRLEESDMQKGKILSGRMVRYVRWADFHVSRKDPDLSGCFVPKKGKTWKWNGMEIPFLGYAVGGFGRQKRGGELEKADSDCAVESDDEGEDGSGEAEDS